MSIIYDALKKVEKKIHPIPKEAVAAPTEKKRPSLLPYVAPVLMVCIIVAAGWIVLATLKQKPKTPQAAVTKVVPQASASAVPPVVVQPPQPQTEVTTVPSETPSQTPQEPKLTLNGVFFSQDGAYALINNQIVREGDMIEGVKVVRILSDTVELDYNGSPRTLSTK